MRDLRYKSYAMDTERAYEIFGRMIAEDCIYLIGGLTFGKVCRSLETDMVKLDMKVRRELGMGGEQLLESLRADAALWLQRKYALKGFIL